MTWHEQTAPPVGTFVSGKSAGTKTAHTFSFRKHRISPTQAEPKKEGGQ